MTTRLDAALTYAAKGWRVFPLRGKLPAIAKADGGRGVHDATTDEQTIKQWWDNKEHNVGIACGSASGIWVLDIDGDDGEESLAILEHEHGNLPPTVESHTGRGRHIFFKCNGEEIGNKVAVRVGLDTRADGGYVVAPPSYHKGHKREYVWSVDGDPEDMAPVDAPAWLIELIGANDTASDANDATAETFTDAYGEAALKAEADAVTNAPIGNQENTLNNAALKIGGLVGSGHIGYDDALESLVAAGLTMTCDPKRDAWSEAEIRDKVPAHREEVARQGQRRPCRALPPPRTQRSGGGIEPIAHIAAGHSL